MDLIDRLSMSLEGIGPGSHQFGHLNIEVAYSISRGTAERPCTEEGRKNCEFAKKCTFQRTGDCLAETTE